MSLCVQCNKCLIVHAILMTDKSYVAATQSTSFSSPATTVFRRFDELPSAAWRRAAATALAPAPGPSRPWRSSDITPVHTHIRTLLHYSDLGYHWKLPHRAVSGGWRTLELPKRRLVYRHKVVCVLRDKAAFSKRRSTSNLSLPALTNLHSSKLKVGTAAHVNTEAQQAVWQISGVHTMRRSAMISPGFVVIVKAAPTRPARAVRPTRCTYARAWSQIRRGNRSY
jgi:hypothetical protein